MRVRTICTLLLCLTAGCYRYNVRPVPPVDSATEFRATKARITLRDGREVRMERAYVRGDSLRTDDPFNNSPAAVALADIDRLQVGEISRSKTVLGVLAVTEVLIAGFYVVILATDDS
jgi:hypothetical protein